MKFLRSKLSLGKLYTDDTNANDTDDNTTQWTEHDCIGSLPNEPKKDKNSIAASTKHPCAGEGAEEQYNKTSDCGGVFQTGEMVLQQRNPGWSIREVWHKCQGS